MHSHITDGVRRTGGNDKMFVAGATREQKSFEGGLQKIEIQKITCDPCASFLLVMTFSYTLHDS